MTRRDRVEEHDRSATVFSGLLQGLDFVTEKQATDRAGGKCQEGKEALYSQRNEFFVFSPFTPVEGEKQKEAMSRK
jgi:hypothetical protein